VFLDGEDETIELLDSIHACEGSPSSTCSCSFQVSSLLVNTIILNSRAICSFFLEDFKTLTYLLRGKIRI
jgi:hypothetical protein